jgi:PilZ domain
MSASTAATAVSGKVFARTASVHIDEACNAFLQDCFKQFGIQVVPLLGDPRFLLNHQKFEACVLRLYDPEAEKILESARSSKSNRRIVIYGIARNTQESLSYSRFGINAVLMEPLDRQSVLKVVRSTHLLVIHELRRYVRVPVVAEAEIDIGPSRQTAVMLEVSSGGMSVRCPGPLPSSDMVNVSAKFPGLDRLTVRAYVCWARAGERVYGLRFDPHDDRRLKIRSWIDQYLEIV